MKLVKVKVEVSLIFSDKETGKAIYRSLEPDNIGFPADVSFGMSRRGGRLNFKLASSSYTTLLSTLDDLLESAQVSIDTLKETKKMMVVEAG